MKKCPLCAEEIQDAALKCKHCGEMLSQVPGLPLSAPTWLAASASPTSPTRDPRWQQQATPPTFSPQKTGGILNTEIKPWMVYLAAFFVGLMFWQTQAWPTAIPLVALSILAPFAQSKHGKANEIGCVSIGVVVLFVFIGVGTLVSPSSPVANNSLPPPPPQPAKAAEQKPPSKSAESDPMKRAAGAVPAPKPAEQKRPAQGGTAKKTVAAATPKKATPPPKPATREEPDEPEDETPMGPPRIGDMGKLKIPHGGEIFVAVTEEDFDALAETAASHDVEGTQELLLNDRLFAVPSGTKVRFLDAGGMLSSRAKIRIMEGPMYPRTGWVPTEWVKRK